MGRLRKSIIRQGPGSKRNGIGMAWHDMFRIFWCDVFPKRRMSRPDWTQQHRWEARPNYLTWFARRGGRRQSVSANGHGSAD
jgi:hypothetical protein